MTFIVILIALLIERFFDWSHLRRWHWLAAFQRTVLQRMKTVSPYVTLALTIVPLLIVVFLIDAIVQNWLYGFVKLLFNLVILLYCFGPQNFWANAFAALNALTQGDAQLAADKLKLTFGIVNVGSTQSMHRQLLENLFIQAHRRVFAVVFWYFILGVVGAVVYRAIALSSTEASEQDVIPALSQPARWVETVLDWIPVRVFTFIFALGGHFVQVFTCWRKEALLGLQQNETMLVDCGIAALDNEMQGTLPEDGSAEKSAMGLLDRSFVIVLVIVAIFVLIL